MSKKNRHVVPQGKSWAVKSPGNENPTSRHRTQKAAIDAARKGAKKDQSEMFIHGKDGRIRERNTYGKDPFPPRG